MTRQELIELIKHKKWSRKSGVLRCEKGDCPIIAAFNIKFPDLDSFYDNVSWSYAAEVLGLSFDDARNIVREADTDFGKKKLDKELGFVE